MQLLKRNSEVTPPLITAAIHQTVLLLAISIPTHTHTHAFSKNSARLVSDCSLADITGSTHLKYSKRRDRSDLRGDFKSSYTGHSFI